MARGASTKSTGASLTPFAACETEARAARLGSALRAVRGVAVSLAEGLRIVVERAEAHAGPPFVHTARVIELVRLPGGAALGELSPVALRAPLRQQHPVGEVGVVALAGLAGGHRFSHQVQAQALEGRIMVCVLGE